MVGFAGATGRTVPISATRIYEMSFFTGFGVSAIVYYTLNIVYPAAGAATTFQEVDLSAEEDLDVARMALVLWKGRYARRREGNYEGAGEVSR